MKAKELAKLLRKHPDWEVKILWHDYPAAKSVGGKYDLGEHEPEKEFVTTDTVPTCG